MQNFMWNTVKLGKIGQCLNVCTTYLHYINLYAKIYGTVILNDSFYSIVIILKNLEEMQKRTENK